MEQSLDEIISKIAGDASHSSIAGLSSASVAYVTARIFASLKRSMFVVAPTSEDAERLAADLQFCLETDTPRFGQNQSVFLLPNYEFLSVRGISPPVEITARRLGALYAMLFATRPYVVVASTNAAMQRVVPRSDLSDHAELVMAGEEIDREKLIKVLVEGGYFHTTLVEQKGDFSIRGDLLDIFPPQGDFPVRIEFFGDYVESMRLFEVGSQRSFADLQELVVIPVSEIIRAPSNLKRALNRLLEMGPSLSGSDQMKAHLAAGNIFPGAESVLPLFYDKTETVAHYLDEKALVVYVEPSAVQKQAWEETTRREPLNAALGEWSPYISWTQAEAELSRFQTLSLPTLIVEGELQSGTGYRLKVEGNEDLRILQEEREHDWGHKRKIIDLLEEWRNLGIEVNWVCESVRRAEHLYELFSEYGISARIERPPFVTEKRYPSSLRIFVGSFSKGFRLPSEGLVVITDREVHGPRRSFARAARPRREAYFSSFEDLKVGDLVVHVDHGVGRYEGLVRLAIDGVPNDFLLIQYEGQDRLYIPVYNLKVIQKYVGVEGQTPRLDRLGGKTWSLAKRKVRKEVEKLARELLEIAAARNVKEGFAFSKGDGLIREFEEKFPFEETPDQLRAVEDVLADMESSRPMDRLVCGDVGYGKTEVALRAAYKCVLDGKQVCFLVPTTVLAAQHYDTFKRRFQDYAVEIEVLSRFQNPKQQKKILEGLQTGRIDIVIGTHRLLQKDVLFRDLGLLIVDEEQRFGVAHKERIKKLKTLVDVLTLTATPIPRTLHMALAGIRDLSTIETPPRDRLAIKTYLAKFDDAVIKGAVERELERGGQVFFVHNRVQTIEAMARHVQRLVPRARIGVAHGQLKERDLEKVMLKFLLKEIDVLVCTVIIESGLDIPSANTIIINQADRFGLAQIYQLRGRVGRSAERAYAYLLISGESTITEEAKKRLKVLMDFTELGAGFKIAFHDLQIRGGGEIFGPSQSGHVAAVGYEMYLQLLEEAINHFKGKDSQKYLDPEINLHIPALFPEDYIPSIDQRLSLYKRLSMLGSQEAVSDMKEELTDRFGKPPQEVQNLLEIISLKNFLRDLGVKRLDRKGSTLAFSFEADSYRNWDNLVAFVQKHKHASRLTPEGVLYVKMIAGDPDPLAEAKKTLQQLS
jgi:transcription-repair coupling factor (superfamily II helicase)